MNIDWIIVPVIAGLCYGVGLWYKACPKIKDELIPALEATTGAIFGAIAYFLHVSWLEAGDILTALFIGVGSGLAATGANQIVKQIAKLKPENGGEVKHEEGRKGTEV